MKSLLANALPLCIALSFMTGCASFTKISEPTLYVDGLKMDFSVTYETNYLYSQHHVRLKKTSPPLKARNQKAFVNAKIMKDSQSKTLFGVVTTRSFGNGGNLTFFAYTNGALTILDRDTINDANNFGTLVMRGGKGGLSRQLPDRSKAEKVVQFFKRNVPIAEIPRVKIDNYFPSDPQWVWKGTGDLNDGLVSISGAAMGVYLDGPASNLFRRDKRRIQVDIVPQSGYWNRDPSDISRQPPRARAYELSSQSAKKPLHP